MKPLEFSPDERQLRRTLRDLVALSTLPAMWAGFASEDIAASLGEALLKILALDYVTVRFRREDRETVSSTRGRHGSAAAVRAVDAALAPWLAVETVEPPLLCDPEDGAPLALALARFGHSGDYGVVVALSRREGFPSEVERLLLGVGANHTATVLQRKRDEDALRRQNRALQTLTRFSCDLAAERDLGVVTQKITDAGCALSGAAFGALFYNVVGTAGESYMLYSLAGAAREDFARFPMPRNTELFGPTFRGEGTIRIPDVRRDPRYGKWSPYHGLPPGHLPVSSYLATPVVSRSGEVIGGLFFGHPEPGVFGAESETLVEALAAHAAIAIDNARLYESLQTQLTERRAVEEALREAAERKDDFLALLGHELRNPLAPVRNCLQILEHLDHDPDQRAKARDVMARQVAHLTRLVDDLLDVSRISRGTIELRKERLDAVHLMRQVVEDHRRTIQQASLELDVDLPAVPCWVDGDRVRLAQAIGNLLENACKFTDQGGHVRVSVACGGAGVELRVADDGIGISAGDLPRIFEPFRQSPAARARSQSGLGLGLSVVKRLAELHGGTAQASSAGAGLGTEIVLQLPLAAAPVPAAEVARPAGAALVGADHRILLVEDHLDAAESLAKLLRLHGHRVEVAHDGSEGISKARVFLPDVVLCDIGLPGGIDGYAVARAVRREALPREPFLVALTGFGQETDRRRAFDAGFDAHLTKPADPVALQRLLAGGRHAAPRVRTG